MKLPELFKENDDEVNFIEARLLRLIMVLLLAVWLLNIKGIFIIDTYSFNRLMLYATVFLLFPTLLVDILGIKGSYVKYIVVACSICFVSIFYVYLTYHVVILFVLPIALASLYFNSKLIYFSAGASVVAMVISHVMSDAHKLINSDPFDGMYQIIVYGLTPRLIEYLIFSTVIVILTKRTSNLLKSSYKTAEDLKKGKDGLDIILNNTNALFKARNRKELATVIFAAFKCVISTFMKINPDYSSYFGIADNIGTFFFINDNLKCEKIKQMDDMLRVEADEKEFYIPCFSNETEHVMYMEDGFLIMSFYIKHNLAAFCLIRNDFFNLKDERLKQSVDILYGNVLLAVSNIKLQEDMYQTQEELVKAFAEVCESKSKQTGQHIKRVSEYMKVMADALELEEGEKDNLVIASMMHDIGKLLIPSEIIEKKGKLTEEEFAEVKKHVQYGYDLLKYSPGRVMEIAKVIALQHHEKWNGQGYLGMKRDEIDFYSRVMAVVDVFDALVSKRSYKEKWPIERAYDEIVSESGQHFDPKVVRLFQDNFSRFTEIVEKYPD